VHLLEQEASIAAATRNNHDKPAFNEIMNELSPYIGPYRPDSWRGPQDAVAKVFYRWRAED